jgi:hypothetical protein
MRMLAAAIRAVLQKYYCESIRIHTQYVRCLVSFDLILHHDCISKKLSMGLDIGSVFFFSTCLGVVAALSMVETCIRGSPA